MLSCKRGYECWVGYGERAKFGRIVLLHREEGSILESKLVERLLKKKCSASNLSATRLISESLRRIGKYATDVAQVALNLIFKSPLNFAALKGNRCGRCVELLKWSC